MAWTIDSMRDGTILTSKGGAFADVEGVDVVDALTLRVRLKRPVASLLFNLSDGVFGVVPRGAGKELWASAGGFGGVSDLKAQRRTKTVMVVRNRGLLGRSHRVVGRVRFASGTGCGDGGAGAREGICRCGEQRTDAGHGARARRPGRTEDGSGGKLAGNVSELQCGAQGPLRDVRVRQAVAMAMDREEIVQAVWRGKATLANTLLPAGHWAAADLPGYPHDVARAAALLDAAGYKADKSGVRVRLEMKTSQDETTRLLAEILQQQLAAAGIALTLRAAEFGTFYSDVTAGRFEMYALNWVGSNEDPDIYRYAYGSGSFPPKGGNRGHYANAEVDELLTAASNAPSESARRDDYVKVQTLLLEQVPSVPLWYPRNEVVHTNRLHGMSAPASGNFDFLRNAWMP